MGELSDGCHMSQSQFPGAYVPAVSLQNGNFTTPWILWLGQFAAQPAAPFQVVPTGSPFRYTASGPGSLSVSGGTVSARTLTRGGVSAPIGASLIPMVNGDVATITYSVAPTLWFVPG
jgi:hypothetical protein